MKQRAVHFGGVSHLRLLPALQITEAEKETLWFSKTQLGALRLLAENEHVEQRAVVFRKRSRYIRYVLHLQKTNRESGIEDLMGLRALAVAQSKSASESARFRAEKNAAEVVAEAYHNEVARAREEPVSYVRTAPALEGEAEQEDQSCSCSRNSSGRRSPIQTPRRNRTAANMA